MRTVRRAKPQEMHEDQESRIVDRGCAENPCRLTIYGCVCKYIPCIEYEDVIDYCVRQVHKQRQGRRRRTDSTTIFEPVNCDEEKQEEEEEDKRILNGGESTGTLTLTECNAIRAC
ncbi:hypothetical protein KQX54_020934 [Cotesia glomerata]|uniref:Uncharacterized protein n=1 Tax=Cotesia glomerata TaxID=32391 RepID=A0AAV7I213_COTGL|nr:hypothetical protein KQX54_020934 [Cotesia glomerata]